MKAANPFPTLLEAFFIDRLVRQRQVSPHTLASYRDTFRLLLQYAQRQLGKAPSALTLPDLDTPFLGAFLDHLEQERDNSARSRNVRLAAIHSFFRYVALHAPEHSALAQRVLAMPSKRYPRRPIDFLAPAEVAALLAAPNLDTWSGRRDRALLLLAVQTGLRASELLGLRCQDIVLGPSAHVQCQGKGRKVRSTPLRKETATVLRNWFQEHHGQPSRPAFPTTSGAALSHDGLQYLLNKHLAVACRQCASLSRKARDAPRAAAHAGDGTASPWRRPFRDRSLAGPRVCRDDIHLSACRYAAQGSCASQNPGRRCARTPIPTRRSPSDLSQEPLIMPIPMRANLRETLGSPRHLDPHSE